jgi:hypothetical protein
VNEPETISGLTQSVKTADHYSTSKKEEPFVLKAEAGKILDLSGKQLMWLMEKNRQKSIQKQLKNRPAQRVISRVMREEIEREKEIWRKLKCLK